MQRISQIFIHRGRKMPNIILFYAITRKKTAKYLHSSEKSSTFAFAFENDFTINKSRLHP